MSDIKVSKTFPILLVLYEISTYLSNDMYLPALPEIREQLHITSTQVQWTLTAWFIGLAIMPLFFGSLSDRFGRRPILLGGGVIYFLATIGCALSPNLALLLIFRFFEGAAIPSLMVAGYSAIHESYSQKSAIRILAIMGSVSILAPALGPLMGSIILTFTGWRDIFWFIAIWSGITICLLIKWMPETHPQKIPIHFENLFKSYGRILTNRYFMLQASSLGLIIAGFLAWIVAGPLLVIENFHQSIIRFGLIQAFVFLFYILGNLFVKYLIVNKPLKNIIKLSFIIIVSGAISAAILANLFSHHLFPFLFGLAIFSLGSAIAFAPLNRLVIESSNEPMGTRMAMFSVIFTSYGTLGTVLASFFYTGTVNSLANMIALLTIGSLYIQYLLKEHL